MVESDGQCVGGQAGCEIGLGLEDLAQQGGGGPKLKFPCEKVPKCVSRSRSWYLCAPQSLGVTPSTHSIARIFFIAWNFEGNFASSTRIARALWGTLSTACWASHRAILRTLEHAPQYVCFARASGFHFHRYMVLPMAEEYVQHVARQKRLLHFSGA